MHGVHFICSNINLAEKIHSRYTSWPFHSTVSSLISCNTATFWWTFVDFFFFQFLYVFDDTWFMCDAKKFNEARTSFVGNISLYICIYIPNRTIFSSLRDDIQKKSRIKITLNYEYTRRKIFSSNGDDVNAPAVRQQLTRLVMIAKRWIKSKSDGEHIVPHSTRLITFSVFFCYQQFCCCFMSLPRKRAHWPR